MRFFAFMLFISLFTSTMADEVSLTLNGMEMKTISRSDFALYPFSELFLDQDKYNNLVKELEGSVYEKPQNASLDKNGNMISEKNGYKLNHKLFKKKFNSFFFSKNNETIEIPLQTIYPKVDSELLENISQKRISFYKTSFNPKNKERAQNIHLASNAINNYVLFPGETFSFNAIVGERTTERGYLPAPEIVKGELTEGIGGGICQVSSTLFNAVDIAGVNIVERYSHSRNVTYVPPKRDATVSWYGPDFKFQNLHQQPLLIRSKIVNSHVIIEIFSSETFSIQ
ncbi:hypothetical protein CHH83_16375 [Bacillus sp. 7586-K]|nr:hypothetical protein CHH83_16375 [Bacillus sp. 7586-K]